MTAVNESVQGEEIRKNKYILQVLQQVMGPQGPHHGGNWGQWNFGGSDPSAASELPLAVGALAAVVGNQFLH